MDITPALVFSEALQFQLLFAVIEMKHHIRGKCGKLQNKTESQRLWTQEIPISKAIKVII